MRDIARRLSCGLVLAACVSVAGCRAYRPPRPDAAVALQTNSAPAADIRASNLPSTPPTANESDEWLVEQRCTACHVIERITRVRLGWQGWRGEVGHMVQNGAVLTIPEQQRIVDYLGRREEAAPRVGPSPPLPGTTTSATIVVPNDAIHAAP